VRPALWAVRSAGSWCAVSWAPSWADVGDAAKASDIYRRLTSWPWPGAGKARLIFPLRLGTLRAALHEILVQRFQ